MEQILANTANKTNKNIKARVLRYLRKHYNTKALNKKFPQTRRQRIKKLARAMNLSAKNVYAWTKQGAHIIVDSNQNVYPPLKTEKGASQKTILKTRHDFAIHNARSMYNEVLRKTNLDHLNSDETHSCIVSENQDTVIVVVDATVDKSLYETNMNMLCRLKNKDGIHMCSIQTARPNENIIIPVVKINFKSVLDRPGQASNIIFGSRGKTARVFVDTDGINTASLQLLDRYLSEAKQIVGVDYKMIVLHDDNLYFPDELNHFVHGDKSQLVPLVASRIAGIKLKKIYK